MWKHIVLLFPPSVMGEGEERTNPETSWQERVGTIYFLSLLLHWLEGEDTPELPLCK